MMLNYKIAQEISASQKRIIYRGTRISDNLPVIIKTTTEEYSDKENIAKLHHEYDILKRLESPNIIKAYSIEEFDNRYALIMEDNSFITLQDFMESKKVNLDLFFKIAKQLALILQEIHDAHIIHEDINPSNILIKQEGSKIKMCLIDFHIATSLPQDQQAITSPEGLEGTLPYMAPEQTGRINRPIDKRADLYSLGATLYHLLTGKLLFSADSPIEWIHSHIAKQPKSPHEINADIPIVVSNMMMKLLAKSPEERYHTARGFLADLEQAMSAWSRTHTIDSFPLGTQDKTGIFQVSHKLYGRETDIEKLTAAYQRIRNGSRQLYLISGYSGIGKTSVVNELHKPLTKQDGYFAAGKYEKFQQEVPYHGLIRAFQQLIRLLLTGSNEKIAYWRERLNKVLYPNGQLIIDVIPELANLIGEQPPVPALPATETRNRFEVVFFDFIHAFAHEKHPVIIFLDDFQWADLASINLIKQFLRDESLGHFLLVAAYRDNEVKTGHPVLDMLINLKKHEVPIENLKINPLNLANVTHLISDTLNTQNDISALAALVFEKTGGNPFFVNTFMKKIYDEKYLIFNNKNSEWEWNLPALKSMVITDNVTDIIIDNIAKLTPETQKLLKLAACIGSTFDLSSLALLQGNSPYHISQLLWTALQENLIIPLSDNYRYIQNEEVNPSQVRQVLYKFSHDRIHQAALSMLSPEELETVNFQLGKLLIENLNKDEKEEKLFVIVNHFNNCLTQIAKSDYKSQVADLYFKAGTKAKASVAYDSAIKYFENAIYILGDNNIEKNYELIFAIKLTYAECLHLTGKANEAEKVFAALTQMATTPLDKAKILMLEALSYGVQLKRRKAINACLMGLNTLGMKVAIKPGANPLKIFAELIKAVWRVYGKSMDELLATKSAATMEEQLTIEFTSRIAETAYLEDPNLMALIGLKGLVFSLDHGYSPITAIHFNLLGIIAIAGFQNFKKGYEFGQLAIKIADKYDDIRIRTSVYFTTYVLLCVWILPYRKCFEQLDKVYAMGRQSGELLYAGYASSLVPPMMILQGDKLDQIEEKSKNISPIAEFTENIDALCTIHTFQKLIPALREPINIEPFRKRTQDFLNRNLVYLHPVSYATSGILCLMGAYVLGEWDIIERIIDATEKDAKSEYMKPVYLTPEFYFFSAIVYLSLYTKHTFWEQIKIKRKIRSYLKILHRFAESCPANFESKYQVIRGGLLQLEGKLQQAMKAYNIAIQSAKDNNLLFVEATVNEFIGHMFYIKDFKRQAKLYLQEALTLYHRWGSNSKVTQLTEHYSEFFVTRNTASPSEKHYTSLKRTTDLHVDLQSLMKSTQVIFSKVRLEELASSLLKISIENAGATRGLLLLLQNDTLNVFARCDSPDSEPEVLQNVPLHEYKDLCLSLVQFVSNTKKVLVLDNASITLPYSEDPYVQERKILSIICIPILREDRLIGVLYLENNLAPASFSPERSEILTLLSGQAAISIENARLYSAYDRFVPHEFLDILGKKRIIDIQIGDQVQKEMGVLFSDIRNFTALSERLTPTENFAFVNEYLRFMEPAIRENGGFIDKFIGDAIMALFLGNADDAVAAGIALHKLLEKFNEERNVHNKPLINIGVGVNFGNLMLGTVGGRHRMETTVISDTVNLTSRIESLTKNYKSRLLISEHAYRALKNPGQFHCRFIDNVQIRGKEDIIGIWEVYSADPEPLFSKKLAIAPVYNEAIQAFMEKDYKKALALFQESNHQLPNDIVIKIYIEKCVNLLQLR